MYYSGSYRGSPVMGIAVDTQLVPNPFNATSLSAGIGWQASGSKEYVDSVEARAEELVKELRRWWAEYRAEYPATSEGSKLPRGD